MVRNDENKIIMQVTSNSGSIMTLANGDGERSVLTYTKTMIGVLNLSVLPCIYIYICIMIYVDTIDAYNCIYMIINILLNIMCVVYPTRMVVGFCIRGTFGAPMAASPWTPLLL